MKLVIVESPSKAKTIEKYLKKHGDYKVLSSIGHVRDLPKSNKDAIDIDGGFIPHYEISKGKKSVVDDLKLAAKKSDMVLLAMDPDREGEAIAWHLDALLQDANKNIQRITFNEITEEAVVSAIEKSRAIDQNLRRAQEARRVLDRLVGYDLSGLIWKKVRYGLSAGRVQSPALRIIMEREREIRAFIPEPFWVITGTFSGNDMVFSLVCQEEPTQEDEVFRIIEAAKKHPWHVAETKETEVSRNPKPPFTTSTLQQTASTRLSFTPSRTMRTAQRLYEAGMITYMRTDSTSLAKSAQASIASHVKAEYGEEYVSVQSYATKSKNAQEAHEAIRPTNVTRRTAGMTQDQKDLYDLIWRRTVASQMQSAKLVRSKVIARIEGDTIPDFAVTGARVIFDGWFLADPYARSKDIAVPQLQKGDPLALEDINAEGKETQPPHRYTEAGLIKELEKRGIGRPSTYASTMKTLIDRGYVEKQGRTLLPTDTGDVVSSFLEEHFAEYISDSFTADLEEQLDDIAEGEKKYEPVLSSFYQPFHTSVEAKEDIPKLTHLGDADPKFVCPECGKSMVIKLGRGGKFLSCGDYPDCEGALTIEGKQVGEHDPLGTHPDTGEEIFVLDGRFGPYVQLGKKTDENPKPKRAGLPKDMSADDVDLDTAVRLLVLPRELGAHPESGEMVIANIGRFGPYVGHGREFRSLKKKDGDDPYTITLARALEVLSAPKQLPRGVELVRDLGKHPKTGKDIQLLKSKSGTFLRKGLKRIYFPDTFDTEKLNLDTALEIIKRGGV